MPICPTHGEEMVRVKTSMESRGEGFNRRLVLTEEWLCSKCKLRVRGYYLIVDIGKDEKGHQKFMEVSE